jgi:S1-C subfamily serine protease
LRLTVTAENLSPVVIGGVVVNDNGETIGLVETSNGKEAELIPINNVRRAVERIRQRLVKKHQPWLGARGIPVASISLAQLEKVGWKRADALNLMARHTGIVLTSVPTETPAWLARLRVGDVVTHVNLLEITSADDFSGVLTFLGANKPLLFTVLRPSQMTPHMVSVELVESMNPILSMEAAEDRASRHSTSDPFVARGIEALSMTSDVATRLNARGGLFVVYVHQSSAASRAGMRTGDVIEAVNSEMLTESKLPGSFPGAITLDVIRDGKKIQLTIENDTGAPPRQNQ